MPHRVKHTAHTVVTKIHERSKSNVIDQATLKNEWKVETQDVVTYNFVRLTIEIIKQLQKLTQGLDFGLFVTCGIDAERIFSLRSRNVAELGPGHEADVHGDREHP